VEEVIQVDVEIEIEVEDVIADIREVAVFILVKVERNRPLLTLRFRPRDTVGIVEVMKEEPTIGHVGCARSRVDPKRRGGAHADCGSQQQRKQCPHSHISPG
jgi:hypothetical protein